MAEIRISEAAQRAASNHAGGDVAAGAVNGAWWLN
jgi:hypothetical protein